MALVIESLVAVLLAVTIGYCVLLNRRLKGLRRDEAAMRATVGELLSATETAAQAVVGLKRNVADKEAALASRLAEARTLSLTLEDSVSQGEAILRRLKLISQAARPPAADDARPPRPAGTGGAAAEAESRLAEPRRHLRDEAA